jgi:hypothetical protein
MRWQVIETTTLHNPGPAGNFLRNQGFLPVSTSPKLICAFEGGIAHCLMVGQPACQTQPKHDENHEKPD